jgi:leader peptidase (prepilin peptidase) / N-methyltransferase
VTYVERGAAPHGGPPQSAGATECADAVGTPGRAREYSLAWRLVGASVFVLSFAIAPGVEGALGGALGLIMLGVASADSRRFVVPNALTGGAFALGLIHAAATGPDSGFEGALMALSRAALAAGLFMILRVAYRGLRGREGVGLGDVKLAAVAGAWLTLPMLPIAIEIAAITALAAYTLRQRKRVRVLRAVGRVPFGAFLAPAIWFGWVLDTMLPNLN